MSDNTTENLATNNAAVEQERPRSGRIAEDSFCPFVVFGASKSGTTWLQRLLDSHPDIRCHFQRSIFPIHGPGGLRPCRAKIALSQYKSPYDGVFGGGDEEAAYLLTHKYVQDLSFLHRDYLEQYRSKAGSRAWEALEQLHRAHLQAFARAMLVDQSEAVRYGTKSYTDIDLLMRVFPDSKVIHIIRDGRDIAISMRFHQLRIGSYYVGDERSRLLAWLNHVTIARRVTRRLNRTLGWFGESWYRDLRNGEGPLLSTEAVRKIARDWSAVVRYLLTCQERFPDNFYSVRYEDLLVAPETALEGMLKFLDVDASPPVIANLLDATSFGNKSRGAFFRKGIAGDWRNHFTTENAALFHELAGDELIKLGYAASPEWVASLSRDPR